jgi:cytochrome P450
MALVSTITKALIAAVPILFIRLILVVRKNRTGHLDIPQPKRSMLWGHLALLGEIMGKMSPGAQIGKMHRPNPTFDRHVGSRITAGLFANLGPDHAFERMAASLDRPSIMFVDLWPVMFPFVVVTNHTVAEQISRATKQYPYSLPKSPSMRYLRPLTGPDALVLLDGEEWKGLRKRYNPGFAPSHIATLLPAVLDKVVPFLGHLDRLSESGEVVVMGDYTTNVTFDIIGKVTMDMELRAQEPNRGDRHPVLNTYLDVIETYKVVEDTPMGGWLLHPINHLQQMWHAYKIRPLLRKVIHDKHAEMMGERASGQTKTQSRSVLALSLQGEEKLSRELVESTIDNLKTFLFAGHDTTSITMQWTFYELERSPKAAAALHRELDELFGPDPDPKIVMDVLRKRGDDVLSKMTYTSAVIKEILRLYPAGGSARYTPPGTGLQVRDPKTGRMYCLDGAIIYNCATLIQRDEEVYGPTANQFVPERWIGNSDVSARTNGGLVDVASGGGNEEKAKGPSAAIPASAWRPFERGPRNCIGQELANMEAKVIIACVARRFEFIKVGVGAMKRDEKGGRIIGEDGYCVTEGEPLYSVSLFLVFLSPTSFLLLVRVC